MSALTPPVGGFRITTRILVVLASVLAFLAIFASWVDRQALDTDEWVETSGELLEKKAVSDAIADYAVDELFAAVDVNAELRRRLPDDVKSLAGPAAGGLQEFARQVAKRALQTAQVQGLWRDANRTAHETLLAILADRSAAVSTSGGEVTLELRPLVEQLADRVGVSGNVSERIPADVAELRILTSEELDTAQTIADLVQGAAWLFTFGSLASFALAAWLGRGRRWMIVLGFGIGLIAAGIAAKALRGVGEELVVDALITTEAARPAAESSWEIATSLLASISTGVIIYGLLLSVAAWLASPADSAESVRLALAPSLRERAAVVWSLFAALALLYLIIDPPEGTRQLSVSASVIALAAVGLEALRRKTAHEYPDVERGAWRRRLGERARELGSDAARTLESAVTSVQTMGGDDRIRKLERLADLRDRGMLDERELAAEKKRILAEDDSQANR